MCVKITFTGPNGLQNAYKITGGLYLMPITHMETLAISPRVQNNTHADIRDPTQLLRSDSAAQFMDECTASARDCRSADAFVVIIASLFTSVQVT